MLYVEANIISKLDNLYCFFDIVSGVQPGAVIRLFGEILITYTITECVF